MTDTRTGDIVGHYVASLRDALSDLPAQDVDEVMEDVGLHVAEVADELRRDGEDGLDERLRERLGTPEQHAAELRAAAGYPPREIDAAKPDLLAPRIALGLLAIATIVPLFGPAGDLEGLLIALVLAGGVALASLLIAVPGGRLSHIADLPEVQQARERAPGGVVREYALLLQPAWWVIRAGIAAALLAWLLEGYRADVPVIALLTIPLALASIWVGRRSRKDRRWLWAVLPLNSFAVAAVLLVSSYGPWYGIFGGYGFGFGGVETGASVIVEDFPTGNIHPFDANGKPLDGVYLYDDQGYPIKGPMSINECEPFGDTPPPPANRYPLPEYEISQTEEGYVLCVERRVVPPSLQDPVPTPTGSASPTAPTTSGASVTTTAPATTTAPPTT